MTEIPITLYYLPNGRKTEQVVSLSDELGELYSRFANAGFRFEYEKLTTEDTSWTVVHDDFDYDLVIHLFDAQGNYLFKPTKVDTTKIKTNEDKIKAMMEEALSLDLEELKRKEEEHG